MRNEIALEYFATTSTEIKCSTNDCRHDGQLHCGKDTVQVAGGCLGRSGQIQYDELRLMRSLNDRFVKSHSRVHAPHVVVIPGRREENIVVIHEGSEGNFHRPVSL